MERRQTAKAHNFSAAFEQMCFVAIASRESSDDVLRQLVLQCFVVLPDESFSDAVGIIEAIDALFGISVPQDQAQASLEFLEKLGHLHRPLYTNYVLAPDIKKQLQDRIQEAEDLEERVKREWFETLGEKYPPLPYPHMWTALRMYLAQSFRRHGIQAAALLDPSIEAPNDHTASLSTMLDSALKKVFSEDKEKIDCGHKAISDFFADIGNSPDRTTYIAQLADGAFSYFVLTTDPESARVFRENLRPLTLFLDTNFLFAVLDLSSNPMVEVSNEVLRAVHEFGLPFSLCYHERTSRELISTIGYYGDRLRERHWSQSLSKAAISSPYLSSIEEKYHQKNALSPTDVETFLRPYEHADVLLANKGISINSPSTTSLSARADLLHDYTEYLGSRNKYKIDTVIDHDVTVLDAVRQMRSASHSTLDAGALLLTCDYHLYRFDWEQSRAKGQMACVVLPNLFMQVLRPFIPSNPDFDRSFVETFAIPEFRTVGSGAAEAASRLLNLIASYAAFPEDTAVHLLSNDLLLDKLKGIKDDDEFRQQVELAIADENAALLEEIAALTQQLEREKKEQNVILSGVEREKQESERKASTAEELAADALAKVEKEEFARKQAEIKAESAERKADFYARIFAAVTSLLLATALLVVINLLRWTWLLEHQNSYALQASVFLLFFLLLLGMLYPKWRKQAWGGSVTSGIVLGLIQLLGGSS